MCAKQRHNYKKLKIWNLGLEIANDITDILLEFPKHEQYDLSTQISRCSVSMPSNIAEGSSRTDKSFSHFLDISLGSSLELGTQLLVAKHRNYINNETLKKIEEKNRRIPKDDNGISKQSQLGSILYFLSSLIYKK